MNKKRALVFFSFVFSLLIINFVSADPFQDLANAGQSVFDSVKPALSFIVRADGSSSDIFFGRVLLFLIIL